MDCFAIYQCNNPQVFVQVFDEDPVTDAAIWLSLRSVRLSQSELAPLAL
jgi:hypothetical protein